jgi:DNA-binding transcriptional LysR family regulator
MDLFSSMKVFVAVVEGGSFAAGADRLATSRALASKQVQKLEEHLGTRLLNRTTRKLSLTETGRGFYEHSVQILADVQEAEQAAGQMSSEPRGLLKVTMPLSYGQDVLGPLVAQYARAHPLVRLDIALSDRKVDIVDEGFDVAIRIGNLGPSEMVARKLGAVRSVVCAAPSYLARHGTPRAPHDLATHACLGYTLSATGGEWRLEGPDGATVVVPVSGPIRADNGDFLRVAGVNGAGVLFQPNFIVADDLAAGRLVRILPAWQSGELGVHAVYPSRKHLSAKVRTFVDLMAARLAAPAGSGA